LPPIARRRRPGTERSRRIQHEKRAAAADAVARLLAGEALRERVIYVPTELITATNAAE
jgi:hypothetical protein